GANERATTPANCLSHRTGRINFSWNVGSRLGVEASVGLARIDDRLPKGDQDVLGFLIAGDFGSPLTVTAAPNGSLAGGWYQPTESVAAISAINTEDATTRLTPSIQAHFTPFVWLTNRLTVGGDYAATLASQMYPKNDFG